MSASKAPLPNIVNPTSWDPTRLRPAFLCLRKSLYETVYGLERVDSDSMHLPFGLALHEAMKVYRLEQAAGGTRAKHALEKAIDSAWAESADWPGERDPRFDSAKNRRGLIRLLVWYDAEVGANDPLKPMFLTNGKPAIELAFSAYVNLDGGKRAKFVVRPDRIVEFEPGKVWSCEVKTTKYALGGRYSARWSPDTQVTGQAIAGSEIIVGEHRKRAVFCGVIVDAIQIGVNFIRFQRSEHLRSPSQLIEAAKTFGDKIREMTLRVAKVKRAEPAANEPDWPMNEASCRADDGLCPFRALCNADPADRPRVMANEYRQREPWDPEAKR